MTLVRICEILTSSQMRDSLVDLAASAVTAMPESLVSR